jgi:enoyl-CoA hydratase
MLERAIQRSDNAMTWARYDGLAAYCTPIDANMSVRVALLRGAGGKAFVAGTDIAQFPRVCRRG